MKLSLGLTPRDYSVAGGAVVYDADALAYFTANTTITSTADKNAINTFYLGLKSDGIYTKIKAMYLPIWGSAASCKWNLVNPLDSNAAYRLTFSTGWTFSSGGALPNGISAYADTFLNSQTNLTNSSNHISFYSRTSTVGVVCEMGTYDASSNNFLQLRAAANYLSGNSANVLSFTTTGSALGFWLGTKRSNTDRKAFRNGVVEATNTTNDSSLLPNISIYLSARNSVNYIPPGPQLYSSKQFSFSSIGDGLTDTQAANLYTRVQTLMTYFGINV